MPVIKIQNKLSGDNKGSSKNSISYLEKEQKFRDKSMRKNETFFNQNGSTFLAAEAVKKLDSNRRGLGKNDAKYYSLTIAPSQKELALLSDRQLKLYAEHFMKLYAGHFNKNVNPDDLVWFGKLEHTRKYKGFKNGNSEKLPPGKKAGQFKSGDQRHIHILVRRKTESNMKLSPLATARSTKSNLTGSQMGFDRTKFFHKCDKKMHEFIKVIDENVKLNLNDFFITRYIKSKNGSFEKARTMGGNEKLIQFMEKIMKSNQKDETELKTQKERESIKEAVSEDNNKKELTPKSLTESEIIVNAIRFHKEIDYIGKIRNISLDKKESNALRVAFRNATGINLSNEHLKKVHQHFPRKGKRKGI